MRPASTVRPITYASWKRRQPVSKYYSRKTFRNGVWYDSAREAFWAGEFDRLTCAVDLEARVIKIERQLPFVFLEPPNEITYVCDFKITYADGCIRYFEVKGFETPEWKIKEKLMRHFYPLIEVRILK